MTWKFDPSDNIPLKTLEGYKKFYEKDLMLSKKYLAYVQKLADKHNLPNEKWMLDRAKEDVLISERNLTTVKLAIMIAKERKL